MMPSLRPAIDRKCKSCLYDPGARGCGCWREQVEACSSSNCPLHAVRPRSKSKMADLNTKNAPRDLGGTLSVPTLKSALLRRESGRFGVIIEQAEGS